MKNIIFSIGFCFLFSLLQAQDFIRVTKANEKEVFIKEKKRIRIKIKHPTKDRIKKITGNFLFSKNKDSIIIRNNFLAKKHKIAIDDILKIKRHPLAMSIFFGAIGVSVAIVGSGIVLVSYMFLHSHLPPSDRPTTRELEFRDVVNLTLWVWIGSTFSQIFIIAFNPLKGYNTSSGWEIDSGVFSFKSF